MSRSRTAANSSLMSSGATTPSDSSPLSPRRRREPRDRGMDVEAEEPRRRASPSAYEVAVDLLLEAMADGANASLRAPSGARRGAELSRRARAAQALGDLSDPRALNGL